VGLAEGILERGGGAAGRGRSSRGPGRRGGSPDPRTDAGADKTTPPVATPVRTRRSITAERRTVPRSRPANALTRFLVITGSQGLDAMSCSLSSVVSDASGQTKVRIKSPRPLCHRPSQCQFMSDRPRLRRFGCRVVPADDGLYRGVRANERANIAPTRDQGRAASGVEVPRVGDPLQRSLPAPISTASDFRTTEPF
jgi:hypothetical protein